MNFRCSELQGALHQPTEILEIDDCWVIPACKGGAVLQASDSKLVFVSREETSKDNHLISEYLFVCCYQFLFFNYCNIYRFYALRQINIQENFFLDGEGINNIKESIQNKLDYKDSDLLRYFTRDFTNIEPDYNTLLSHTVNFKYVYEKFVHLYKTNEKFKEVITLFCETVDGIRPLYNNILQQISQLQTIFETILGKPRTKKCNDCNLDRYVEDWDSFLVKKLKKYMINDYDIVLMIVIKKMLNSNARVKYVHHSKYYNPNTIHEMIADFPAGMSENYSFDT